MGWSIGNGQGGRDIGYGVPAICDHPDCDERIDRGISYCCGGYVGEDGCGLYFCGKHLSSGVRNDGENDDDWTSHEVCEICKHNWELGEDADYELFKSTFDPKPDIDYWVWWKLRDESWAKWREDNKEEVEKLRKEHAGSKFETMLLHNYTDEE